MFRYALNVLFVSTMVFAAAALSGPTFANADENEGMENQARKAEMADAEDLLHEAVATFDMMKADSDLDSTLMRAKAVFVAPDFARAALGAGASGGQGVLLTKQDGMWTNPVFYNFGQVSLGAQAGVSAGQIAMILMTDRAVDTFKQANNFAVSADAGLSIINWSKAAEASAGKGDVVLWSDTEGLFAGAEVAVSDINSDEQAIHAYYGKRVSAADVINGKVKNPHEKTVAQND